MSEKLRLLGARFATTWVVARFVVAIVEEVMLLLEKRVRGSNIEVGEERRGDDARDESMWKKKPWIFYLYMLGVNLIFSYFKVIYVVLVGSDRVGQYPYIT